MNKILLFFACLSYNAFCQEMNLKWFDDIKTDNQTSKLSGLNDDLYILKFEESNFGGKTEAVYLDKYDLVKNTKIFSVKTVYPEMIETEHATFELIHLKKQPIIIVSFFNRKTKTDMTYACKVDPLTGQFKGSFTLIDESKMANKNTYNLVYKSFSTDSTKLLLWHTTTKNDKKDWTVNFKVIGSDLTIEKTADVVLDNCGDDINVETALLSKKDDKVFFICGSAVKYKDGKASGKTSFLFSYGFVTKESKRYELTSPEEYLIGANIQLSKNGVKLYALFTDKRPPQPEDLIMREIKNKMKGIIIQDYPEDLSSVKTLTVELRDDKKSDYASNQYIQWAGFVNGSFLITVYSAEVNRWTDPASNIYGDITVVSQGENGDLKWKKTIKRSVSSSRKYYYFPARTLISDGRVCLVYNDVKENLSLNQNPEKKPETLYEGAFLWPTLVSIGPNGEMERSLCFEDQITRPLRMHNSYRLRYDRLVATGDDNKLVVIGIK
jgi:hypothetical protein